ncbi:hypothetical protein MA16_Dca000400 [Dendrobium catenatum]|uniref:Uncharacterized protein n=1 Tax=Dendrobium catenatum TaxID=906689 RepID=A0A2I0WTS7_9ASPA|nr:hypothetical protein MA16_Dca000400 [Dendrobium catenatum]
MEQGRKSSDEQRARDSGGSGRVILQVSRVVEAVWKVTEKNDNGRSRTEGKLRQWVREEKENGSVLPLKVGSKSKRPIPSLSLYHVLKRKPLLLPLPAPATAASPSPCTHRRYRLSLSYHLKWTTPPLPPEDANRFSADLASETSETTIQRIDGLLPAFYFRQKYRWKWRRKQVVAFSYGTAYGVLSVGISGTERRRKKSCL